MFEPSRLVLPRAAALAAAAAALAAGAVPSAAGSGAGRSSPLYVSPGGSDAGDCSAASPCSSLERAYAAAQPGGTVLMAAGSYPAQRILPRRLPPQSARIVFRPVRAGAQVTVESLEVWGSHLEFRNLRFGTDWPYWRTRRTADDVVFRNDRAPKFEILGSSNVSVLGGVYGPVDDESINIAPESPSDSNVPTNVLIDGVTIHGFHRTDGRSHVDCIHSWAGNGITIRNSTISDCEHFDILFTVDSVVGTPTNVTIENNFLDCCRSGYFSIYLGDQHGETYSNYLIRNNSTDKPIGIGTSNIRTVAGLSFYGNIAPSFQGCGRTGVTADYNVWYAGSKCGPHDQVAPNGFRDPDRHDFHLVTGAAAIDHGDPASYPKRDIQRQRRPHGRRPDAGADEYYG